MTYMNFINRFQKDFPEIYEYYRTKYERELGRSRISIVLLMTMVTGIEDTTKHRSIIDPYNKLSYGSSYDEHNDLKLDLLYKYIQNNTDLIYFRLL